MTGALAHALIVVPEGVLAFGAVGRHDCTFCAYAVALLAGDEIVQQKGAAGAIGHTFLCLEVRQSQAAYFGASSVLFNEYVARNTARTIFTKAAPASLGAVLACRSCQILEIGAGAVEFALTCAVEPEVGSRAVGSAGERDVVFVVVYREGGAAGHAGTLVEEQFCAFAGGAVTAVYAGRAS